MSDPLLLPPSARHLRLFPFATALGFEVVRGTDVNHLGLLNSWLPGTLCPFYDIAFLDDLLANPFLTAVITTAELAPAIPERFGLAIAASPLEAFFQLHLMLAADPEFVGPSRNTQIGDGCSIHPLAVVAPADVVIGRRALIEPFAVLQPGSVLGDDVVVRSGAVIGAQGFEIRTVDGEPLAMPHIGRAVLGDRVEVGTHAVIERNVFLGDTEVGSSCKIAAHAIVSHGARLGPRCILAARAVVSGGTVLGADVKMGSCSTASNLLTLGAGARTVIRDLVTRDVPAGMTVVRNALFDPSRYRDIVAQQCSKARASSQPVVVL